MKLAPYPSIQPKLLSSESGEFNRWCQSNTIADVRVISAKCRSKSDGADWSFRRDLMFRLNTFVLTLPP